jgi:hypothetical protein
MENSSENVLELIGRSLLETDPTLKDLLLKKIEDHPDNYYRALCNDLTRPCKDYKNCYFKESHFDGAILEEFNLTGANLTGANLICANLEGANLNDANFSCSNLTGSNLTWANLEGANLEGANLNDANLQYANLERAKTNDPEFHKKHPETILTE